MEVKLSELTGNEIYKLMNCMIVPRPIAWVTTLSEEGIVNLAPFSNFNIVCFEPPLLGMNVNFKSDGSLKDTARNARARGELVVHIADETLLSQVHDSAVPHPADVSEAELLGLQLAPSVEITTPRLRDAPLAMECKLHQVLSLGAKAEFVISRIVRVHAREGLMKDYKIDTNALRPLARLAGPNYAGIGQVISKAGA